MKYIWLLAAAAVLLLPGKGTDVSERAPVGVVYVSQEPSGWVIKTDMGDEGRGITLNRAREDLEATAVGNVFLDTAEVLLLQERDREVIPKLSGLVSRGTKICLVREQPPLEKAEVYLNGRELPSLLRAQQGEKIPVLRITQGRFLLENGR